MKYYEPKFTLSGEEDVTIGAQFAAKFVKYNGNTVKIIIWDVVFVG